MTTVVHYICVHCRQTVNRKPGKTKGARHVANGCCDKCLAKILLATGAA
jgi:DNA-directed RNA polymerase subunit RPC12/RpoP